MAQVKFGSAHTVKKLDCLERYLKAYLNVFKNQDWAHTMYVDAFAGTGEIPTAASYPELQLDSEGQAFILGSVRRALELSESFREYVFIEKQQNKMQALEKLRGAYPEKQIDIKNIDANRGIKQLCSSRDWNNCRAVVFLDPFGSQVEWSTIEALAATRSVDLWYLFPAGLSVHRQIGGDGTIHYTHETSLDRLFGTKDWRQAFIDEQVSEPDLFGHKRVLQVKTATPESVTRFMQQRMEGVFKGGVLDEWMPLGRQDAHWYSLMFAWANPSESAKKAGKIARAVIRGGKRGRHK